MKYVFIIFIVKKVSMFQLTVDNNGIPEQVYHGMLIKIILVIIFSAVSLVYLEYWYIS